MQEEEQAIRWDVHPDLALMKHGEKEEILCLVLQADEKQARALYALGAFCIYRQGARTALLYEQRMNLTEQLAACLGEHGLQAGLSGPFALPASARGCMLKAQLALQTGRLYEPGKALYSMDEWGEVALVRAAAHALEQQGFAAEDFCDATLWQMQRADEQKETSYARSVEAYLRCGMDMKRAAGELGVHRNTLAYRLERAKELFHIDFEDMNRSFELLFSSWLHICMPEKPGAVPAHAPFDAQDAQAALWQHMERSGTAGGAAGGYACALVCVGVSGKPDAGRTSLLERLMDSAGPDAAFAYDEDVLFAALSEDALAGFLPKAQALCRGLGCPLVYTQAFDAGRMAQHAQLCRMALCTGAGACVCTRELCSTLFFMAVERSASLAPYLCEDVIRVMDEDARRGTALSRSLYAYLLNFRDMKRAAQQLGMHRNTMEYHMRKVDDLIGRVEDEAHRFMMMCTYKMLALPDRGRYGL